jgi:hypothetical protein
LSGEVMRARASAYFLSCTRANSFATRPTARVLNSLLIVAVGVGLAVVDDVELSVGLGPAVTDAVELAVGVGLTERGDAELVAGDGLAPDSVDLPPHPTANGNTAMASTSMRSEALFERCFMILLQSNVGVRPIADRLRPHRPDYLALDAREVRRVAARQIPRVVA